jgi:hypothetical protein
MQHLRCLLSALYELTISLSAAVTTTQVPSAMQMALSAMRLFFMTSDAALGQPDAHVPHLSALLATPAFTLPVATLLHRLTPATAQPPLTESNSAAQPADVDEGAVPSTAQALTRLLSAGQLLSPSSAGGGVFSSAASPQSDFAGALASQFASASLGHPVFGAAVALTLRRGGVAAAAAWRALATARALPALPAVEQLIGAPQTYNSEVVTIVQAAAAIAKGSVGDEAATSLRTVAELPPLVATIGESLGEAWTWRHVEGAGGDALSLLLLRSGLLAHLASAAALLCAPQQQRATGPAEPGKVKDKHGPEEGSTARAGAGDDSAAAGRTGKRTGGQSDASRGRWRLLTCCQAVERANVNIVDAVGWAADLVTHGAPGRLDWLFQTARERCAARGDRESARWIGVCSQAFEAVRVCPEPMAN